jgi:threonine dehydrogenase-like Zn-dependent dehydrogenase
MYFRDVSLTMGMPPVRPAIPDVLNLLAENAIQPEAVITDIDRMDNAPKAIQRYLTGTSTKTIIRTE